MEYDKIKRRWKFQAAIIYSKKQCPQFCASALDKLDGASDISHIMPTKEKGFLATKRMRQELTKSPSHRFMLGQVSDGAEKDFFAITTEAHVGDVAKNLQHRLRVPHVDL